MVLVSPPLPGIITQHRRGPTDRALKNHGIEAEGGNNRDDRVYGKGGDEHDDSKSNSSGSGSGSGSSGSSSGGGGGSESDGGWSDDEPDRKLPSRF